MNTKYCPRCECVYTVEMFAMSSASKDGRAYRCRKCDQKQAVRRGAYGKQRNIDAKLDRGCCEVTGTKVTIDNLDLFEWDHIDPSQKKNNVSELRVSADKTYFAEIAKCRLILRSVHMAHTRQQHAEGVFNHARTDNPDCLISSPPEQLSMFEEHAQ